MRKSQFSASSNPPVIATPLIAPISGLVRCGKGPRPRLDDDPRVPPYSADAIAASVEAVTKAQEAVADAAATLAATDPAFDAFDAARAVGARFCWWPQETNRDPRRFHYQGQPLTDAEVTGLGPHSLRRAITNGAILEVPQ